MNTSATPYALLVPGMALLFVFMLLPIGYGLWLSVHDFDGLHVGAFAGLAHYREVLSDPSFLQALGHTVIFAIIVVIGKNVVGLALASLVSLPLRGSRAVRTILFLPVTLNIIVIGAFWTFFLSARRFGGLFNEILFSLGLGSLEASWLATPGVALVTVALVEVWRWSGLHMLIFLAGMQTIDPSLYDAARLDGANAWARFRNVTLPQLKPILFVSTLLALMGAFVRSFDVVWVLTRAGFGTDVVVTHLYNEAFQFGRFDRAAAMGYILFAIIAVISFVYVAASKGGRANV
ncbi:sugar ABC transporter permease [Kaistia dalseonensis]|uniref:ABC-type sugar transport system permease subunit n=1 Tax=Kaistia dalseonensis TaxID=410840 RepID=A0ABU0H2R7_9HYPH|nr:sugar ABC transporter permease [Kaistia dalseonensis]MCX5494020.1 sugar ABC transporter permease [Kaistia dalseonensis]MDQ0436598.1 ABC-type sugar transport system permease subunit [Kaistia dalseonensis]